MKEFIPSSFKFVSMPTIGKCVYKKKTYYDRTCFHEEVDLESPWEW